MTLFFRFFFKLEVNSAARPPQAGRLILAANHQSYWDPPLLGVSVRRQLFFVAKKQLFARLPVRLLLRSLNSIPLDRRGLSPQTLRRLEAILDQGDALVIFPEGTRSRTGEIGPGREGIGLLALQTQADIQPVYIDGTRHAWPKLWQRRRLYLSFGPIIPISSYLAAPEPRREVMRRLRDEVMSGIRELRRQSQAALSDQVERAGSD